MNLLRAILRMLTVACIVASLGSVNLIFGVSMFLTGITLGTIERRLADAEIK